MTTFNPLDKNDQKILANAIENLPFSTDQDIVKAFFRSKASWSQGDNPSYFNSKDLLDQIRNILTIACETIKKKTQIVNRFNNGNIGYVTNNKLPYMGSSWNYEIVEEKKLFINLILEVIPDRKRWVPFVFMKREDSQYAFWFDNSI